jgi:ubiquitin-conjugating enzyme E2 J2
MASKAAHKRLSKEYILMQREPPPFVWACPDEKNILTWNYLIRGPPDSPFAGGEYHGVLLFPAEYPFKPPGIKMFTPSGRFHPDKKICFSMSDFHPGTWNPAWSVATILTGLLSFMLSDEMTTGSVTSTEAHKRAFASRSHAWNISQNRFKEAFSDYCTPELRDLPNMGEQSKGRSADGAAPASGTPTAVNNNLSANTGTVPLSHSSAISLGASEGNSALTRSSGSSSGGPTSSPGVIEEDGTGQLQQPLPPQHTLGYTAAWRQVIWEKWRWGLLIALAVLVSRLSSPV